MPAFTRYIGIDYSGAETPTASLSCKPRLNRQWRIGNLQQLFAEILSGEKTHEGARCILKTGGDILGLHQFGFPLPSTKGFDSFGKTRHVIQNNESFHACALRRQVEVI